MLGALIGAGSTVLGGLLNRRHADNQTKIQKEFAQKGIQWRAADAEKAGISKLYALGANTASYSPVSIGGGTGDALSAAGQNIGRAIDATASPVSRAGHLATELATVQLEGAKIDNDIKRADLLARSNLRSQPGQPPAIMGSDTTPVVPGQGNSGVKLERKLQPSIEGDPHRSYGVNPEVDFFRTTRGYSPEVPSELGEAQESQPLAAAQWFIRNKLMPALSDARATFPYEAPPGMFWRFNPLISEYELHTMGGSRVTKGRPQQFPPAAHRRDR